VSINKLHEEITMNAPLKLRFARLPALLRDVGPIAAIELLLPGGSLIALLFWLLRRRASIRGRISGSRAPARSAGTIGDAIEIPSHM
jgi:hypothetical protein